MITQICKSKTIHFRMRCHVIASFIPILELLREKCPNLSYLLAINGCKYKD